MWAMLKPEELAHNPLQELTAPYLRLAQISDMHLYETPEKVFYGTPPAHSLQAVLNDIQALERLPEAILVTGDISDNFSEQSYRLLDSMLTPLNIPYYWIPGNHDDADKMYRLVPQLNVSPYTSFTIKGIKVIMLNTVVRHFFHGELSRESLKVLDYDLRRSPDTPTLVAMHHHPIKTGHEIDMLMLKNADAFFNVATLYKQIQGVVFGHIHFDHETQHKGLRLLSAPSTTYRYDPAMEVPTYKRPGYRLLDFNEQGQLHTQVRKVPVPVFA